MYLKAILLVYLSICMLSCSNRKAEKKLIAQTWNNYTAAVTNSNGSEAVKYVDSNTIAYYSYILEISKTADSNTVALLRPDQKIFVLMNRQVFTKEVINTFDGKKLFAYSVMTGIVGVVSGKGYALRNILVDHSKATAELINTELEEVIMSVPFNKEHNDWKINFSSIYSEFSHKIWKHMVEKNGGSEQDLLYQRLKDISDKPIDTYRIWHPMV